MKKAPALFLALTVAAFTGCRRETVILDKIEIQTAPGALTEYFSNTAGASSEILPEDENSGVLFAHTATVPPDESPEGVVEIKEKLFIAQTNNIYLNKDDYLGKTIKYEGLFTAGEFSGVTYYSVIRYGPGCCGNDGVAGFEVIWDFEYPKADDWVEVTGVLEEYYEDGYPYLRLNLSSLIVLPERGAEFVAQ